MADPFTGDARYHRQMLLPGIGTAGQERLGRAHALVVGCGALGTVIVDALARAGVGTLTIVDRDFVEVTNGCMDLEVRAGQGDSCEVINTVFFEGIPSTGRYAQILMILLMLGLGGIAIRRMI